MQYSPLCEFQNQLTAFYRKCGGWRWPSPEPAAAEGLGAGCRYEGARSERFFRSQDPNFPAWVLRIMTN